MAMMEINWKPGDSQLRQFGFVALIGFPFVGWILSGQLAPGNWESWHCWLLGSLGALGGLLAVVGCIRPQWLKPVFLGLTLLTFPIGLVVGELTMLLIYFGVFTPMALLFRCLGRDALNRRFDTGQASYWEVKTQPEDVRRYYLQS